MSTANLSQFSQKLLSIHTRKSTTPRDDPGLVSQDTHTVPVTCMKDTDTPQCTDTDTDIANENTMSTRSESSSIEAEYGNEDVDIGTIANMAEVPTVLSLDIPTRGEMDAILARISRIEDELHINATERIE